MPTAQNLVTLYVPETNNAVSAGSPKNRRIDRFEGQCYDRGSAGRMSQCAYNS